MELLALKLILTPVIVGGASMAGRRWGPVVGGWLVGLPLTSGPVALFIALNRGTGFAAAAALGIMAGTISPAVFAVVYAHVAFRAPWIQALLLGLGAFGLSTLILRAVGLPPLPYFVVVLAGLAAALRLAPQGARTADVDSEPAPLPAWDLPLRIVVATAFVLVLTGVAPVLGPTLTGLLSPFPLYAGILMVFAQRMQGPGAAAAVGRGLLTGLFSFPVFFLIVAWFIDRLGVFPTFALATAGALAVQGISLWALRFGSRPAPIT